MMDFWRKFCTCFIVSLVLLSIVVQCATAHNGKHYGESCNSDEDCSNEYLCNPNKGKCDCFYNKGNTNSRDIQLFYDSELKLCYSYVNKRCTMKEDGLVPIRCGPNMECFRHRSDKGSTLFGRCYCKSGYESTEGGKVCASIAERRTPKVTAMDQVRPEGWNRKNHASVNAPLRVFLVFGNFVAMFYYMSPIR